MKRAPSTQQITRRAALAAIPVVGLAPIVPAEAASPDRSLAELERLIAAQAEAFQISTAKWDAAAAIEEELVMPNAPACRVQVGRLLGASDDDGNDTWTPMYAYSDEGIDQHYQQDLRARLSWCGRDERAKSRVREDYAELVRQKKAELAAQNAERKRIEDESGYSAAERAAVEATDVVDAVEAAIVSFVPGSLAAAVRKAEWVVAAYQGAEFRSYLCRDQVLDALAAIGKAVAS